MANVAPERRPRFFGRRRGRSLSSTHQDRLDDLLPQIAINETELGRGGDPSALFPFAPKDVWLEIGFGGGEHLAWHAERNFDVGLIGCEAFKQLNEDGVFGTKGASGFATLLILTEDIRLSEEAGAINHPELNALREFWAWWAAHRNDRIPDAEAILDWRVRRLGFWTMSVWSEAFGQAQVPELSAPRPLLPDPALTEEERADPS